MDIAVIDWEIDDFGNIGDPWLDFTDVNWGADRSPHFASGVVKGYFEENPPREFWSLLKFYVFTAILSSMQWVAKTHADALANEIRLCGRAIKWFDDTVYYEPTWYLKNHCRVVK